MRKLNRRRIRNIIRTLLKIIIDFVTQRNFAEETIYSMYTDEKIHENLTRIKGKKVKTVAFFCMEIPLWKTESVYEAMLKSEDFSPLLFIAPKRDLYKKRMRVIKEMQQYFKKKDYNYIPLRSNIFNIGVDLRKYNIDIAFYTKPYANELCKQYSFGCLSDALLCYVPYSFPLSTYDFVYKAVLEKIAWKNFFVTELNIKIGNGKGLNTSNFAISGYPGYDLFNKASELKWKHSDKKKIIWAPHYSFNHPNGWLNISCFLYVYDYMFELLEKYGDRIQIAFRPHPGLFPELCKFWGTAKANSYFEKWRTNSNSILSEGDSYSLFKSADAMIHDSSSFICEFLYTKKPCMYLLLHGKSPMQLDAIGEKALSAHYIAHTHSEIELFIKDTVLGDYDPKFSDRENFLNVILPSNGKSATDNIVDIIRSSLADKY